MEGVIRLVGLAGLAGFLLYVSFLFYDKNGIVSILLLIIGVILSIYITAKEIEFKRKRHEAPWLFDRYKGE